MFTKLFATDCYENIVFYYYVHNSRHEMCCTAGSAFIILTENITYMCGQYYRIMCFTCCFLNGLTAFFWRKKKKNPPSADGRSNIVVHKTNITPYE